MKFPRFLPLLALAALVSGCSTIDSRIKEKSAAFAALDAPTQDKLRLGRVEIGYATDLVYIAMGAPDEKITKTSADRADETWIYNSYYQDYVGTVLVGYRRFIVTDPKTGRPIVFFEPVYDAIYRSRIEERIRVIFRDGEVEAIEQVKR